MDHYFACGFQMVGFDSFPSSACRERGSRAKSVMLLSQEIDTSRPYQIRDTAHAIPPCCRVSLH
jgi:hypothetical protein